MTFPFYKLQLAGNGFILCDFLHFSEDEKDKPEFRRADWKATARKICSRRFGVGASGCIFLGRDNSIQIYNSEGLLTDEADDALLCAARYAFDSGRTDGKKILFHLPHAPEKKLKVDILGANEFRISCGAPFSLLKENVITPGSTEINEIIENEGIDGSYAAVHLREDVLVSWPHKRGAFSFQDFADLTHKAFPKKKVIPVVANPITDDTIIAKAFPRGMSGTCSVAASVLCASVCSGATGHQSMVMFRQPGDGGLPDTMLEQDTDSSRRLAVFWDYNENEKNEIYAVGSGAYIFEGKFDIQENPGGA